MTNSDHETSPVREEPNYPPAREGWYGVGIMSVAMALAFIDRQIPTMLVEPIKADLSMSDTQIALLGGVAFSVFYALMAIPIGFAVDRYQRNRVLGIGILFWSVMTALAGFANSFLKLFGARVGVAAGEAVIAPVSVSLVADYFKPTQQGRAMGIISAGVYVGMGAALVIGGFLIDYFTSIGGFTIPGLGYFKPWQGTFLVVGIPGVLIALAAFRMKEPVRLSQGAGDAGEQGDIIAHIKDHRWSIGLAFAGIAFMAMLTYSFSFWAPTMMVRTYGLSLSEVGLILGMITIFGSSIGTLCCGTVIDLIRARGYEDAPVRVGVAVALACIPFAILAPLVSSVTVAWILIAVLMFMISWLTPFALISVAGVATSATRGRLTAVYAMVMMVFGMSVGPQLTAFFTDFVFQDPQKLGVSVSITAALTLPVSALFLWLSMRHYRESVARLQAS